MKRAREDAKKLGPLFPRLHVKDTDKGGPKAPPRNKMALYEQFSSSGKQFYPVPSMLLLPPGNTSKLVPSNSSSQGCENDVFTKFYRLSSAYFNTSNGVDSALSNGMHHNMTRLEFEKRYETDASSIYSVSLARYRTPNENESRAEGHFTSKLDDVDDFVVPTFTKSGYSAAFCSSTQLSPSSCMSLKISEKTAEASETSFLDSISSLEIYPHDVVGVISQKHFLLAKGAIEKQQRVFAIQVFELHRIIKVQKLIAASPHLLLGSNPVLSRYTEEAPDQMPKPADSISSQLKAVKEQDISKKLNKVAERASWNTIRSPPHTREDKANTSLRGQPPNLQPCSANSVRGLVYKPCMAPCPQPAYFMPPFYRGCALGVVPGSMSVMSQAYACSGLPLPQTLGFLSRPPAITPGYFPINYGLRAMSPTNSASVVNQLSEVADSQSSEQMDHHLRSSCSMFSQMDEAFSRPPFKLQVSKDGELQGSKARNALEKTEAEGKDAQAVYLVAQAKNGLSDTQSCQRDSETRVIKVVPHKATFAIESAARIFRSIQEERQGQEL